jgi:hypothetical protein
MSKNDWSVREKDYKDRVYESTRELNECVRESKEKNE